QSNLEERNAQVAIMGEIYSRAFHVLVWLGPAFQDSELLFRHFSELSDQFPSDRELGMTEALHELAELSWFSRVWTVQEVVLAHNPIV
ncbi:hypothetical protein BDZ45DRAFT_559243, partial [Acephala macrosclerotiorum]